MLGDVSEVIGDGTVNVVGAVVGGVEVVEMVVTVGEVGVVVHVGKGMSDRT